MPGCCCNSSSGSTNSPLQTTTTASTAHYQHSPRPTVARFALRSSLSALAIQYVTPLRCSQHNYTHTHTHVARECRSSHNRRTLLHPSPVTRIITSTTIFGCCDHR
ncbi:hypothetical protein EJ05DRAFT_479547 [Pseudovirgaria hyperparasitica]|uniref:Uncharacterized protein n=1 Tax=Pseudovirgaria hyperparasitica TaxID=470096 RepID=A0A6A6VZ34_9PEZI|nr:uncharacterized protein EJ05DRAFT_479547 [Pseudovirgaria hyperparasitica]KAF2754577.1 hypothetical protein EJ05DRAFT_479547 [Pseudovirgaria hyperparasitica]